MRLYIALVGWGVKMKIKIIIVALILIGVFAYIWKSNNADKERLAKAAEAHQQKLEKEKVDEAESQALQQAKIEKAKNDQELLSNTTTKTDVQKDSKRNYSEEEWLSICKSTASAANAIMSSRQRGVAMTEMMDKVVGLAEPAIKDIVKAFVIDAYNRPRFDSSEYQQKAILDFENYAYLTCVKIRQ